RTARANSSSTSRPEPPPCVSSRRQRGHESRASDQDVMTTVPSRNRHVVRSPLRSGGGLYGPCSSLTRSAWRMMSVGVRWSCGDGPAPRSGGTPGSSCGLLCQGRRHAASGIGSTLWPLSAQVEEIDFGFRTRLILSDRQFITGDPGADVLEEGQAGDTRCHPFVGLKRGNAGTAVAI